MVKLIKIAVTTLVLVFGLGCSSSEIIQSMDNTGDYFPFTYVYTTENQTLTNFTGIDITFNMEWHDDNNLHSTNSSFVTIDYDGDYYIRAVIALNPHPSPHFGDVFTQVLLLADSELLDVKLVTEDSGLMAVPSIASVGGVFRLPAGTKVKLQIAVFDTNPPFYDGSIYVEGKSPYLEIKRLR